jgi:hypothetical protein
VNRGQQEKDGEMAMTTVPDAKLILSDGKGAHVEVEYEGPHQPNVGLGFLLCMDGDQKPQFQSILKSLRHICSSIASANLTATETQQALDQRIVPKISYPLHLTGFDEKMCNKLNTLIRKAVLPTM